MRSYTYKVRTSGVSVIGSRLREQLLHTLLRSALLSQRIDHLQHIDKQRQRCERK